MSEDHRVETPGMTPGERQAVKNWLKRLETLLASCPCPEKLGLYTTGDRDLTAYDREFLTASRFYDEDEDLVGNIAAAEFDGHICELGQARAPVNIEGVCG